MSLPQRTEPLQWANQNFKQIQVAEAKRGKVRAFDFLVLLQIAWQSVASSFWANREIKFDVTWPYVKLQTTTMTSEFVFFSSNPPLNHIKKKKCLLLIATNTNIFTLLFNELKTDGKSFIFAVCSLTYDHVTSNLISLLLARLLPESYCTRSSYLIITMWLVHKLLHFPLINLQSCSRTV